MQHSRAHPGVRGASLGYFLQMLTHARVLVCWHALWCLCCRVCITAGHVRGINYGVTTYLQAIRLCGNGQPELPELIISDCPDLSIRGFMLDVSRNKVCTCCSYLIAPSVHMRCACASWFFGQTGIENHEGVFVLETRMRFFYTSLAVPSLSCVWLRSARPASMFCVHAT